MRSNVNTPIWYLINSETRDKLATLASAGFKPPKDEFPPKTLKAEISSEEIDKEMRKKPRHR